MQIGVPFLAWTLIYWVFTMITGNSWDQAWSLLWNYTLYGYYQLYFVVVLLLLYAVFPAVLRVVRASSHHGLIMLGSLLFALLLAADLHYTSSFGVVGQWTLDIASKWPWARNPITYQEQFVAGILVALHFDEVRAFVERWYRQVIAGAVVMGAIATLWYLIAVWTGSPTGRASDLYQPVAFLWFTAAVAALECGAWMWWRHSMRRPARGPKIFSAEFLAGLTGGIFLCHVLFINLVRSGLGDAGITPHLGWAGTVAADLRAHHRDLGALHGAVVAHAVALGALRSGARRAAGATRPGDADHTAPRRRRTTSSSRPNASRCASEHAPHTRQPARCTLRACMHVRAHVTIADSALVVRYSASSQELETQRVRDLIISSHFLMNFFSGSQYRLRRLGHCGNR